jgi:hypothetical protein
VRRPRYGSPTRRTPSGIAASAHLAVDGWPWTKHFVADRDLEVLDPVTRFDPWQNRPDRFATRSRHRSNDLRSLLVWLAVFAALVVGYTYRAQLFATG